MVGVVAPVGNMLDQERDPFQSVQAELGALGGSIAHGAGGRVVLDAGGGEHGASDIGAQSLQSRGIVGLDRFGAVDLKPAVTPSEQPVGKPGAEAALLDQHPQDLELKDAGHDVGIEIADGKPPPVARPDRVGYQGVGMGMPLQLVAGGLDGDDGCAHHLLGWESGAVHFGQGLPGAAAEPAEQCAVLSENRPQDLGDGEDHLAVRDRFQDSGTHPVDEAGHPLGGTRGAKAPGATGISQIAAAAAGIASQSSQTEVEKATLQETFYGAGDHLPQRAVGLLEQDLVTALELFPVVVQTLVERGLLRVSGTIDAACRLHTLLERPSRKIYRRKPAGTTSALASLSAGPCEGFRSKI